MNEKNVGYLCLGVCLGAVAGILLAPKQGTETREFLRSRAQEGTDYLKQRADDLRNTANEAVEQGKKTIRNQMQNVSAAIDGGKQAYREAVETAPSIR